MQLTVQAPSHSYPIMIESGSLKRVGELLPLNRKVLVVTDSGVPKQYAETVAAACGTAYPVCLPAGEHSKNMDSFKLLLSAMLEAGMTRSDCVVAVGGGMAGDLSGFAAASYMRGVDFYNIPTTLLSQTDSSIGGKTAIDFGGVKNIVGAFWPPKGVLIDPELLSTLPARELAAGLAEIIKMSITGDAALFRDIAACTDLTASLPDFIYRALCIKKHVVEEDPEEKGLRRVLNFGHTIGHAVEAQANGSLLHGECVAMGMLPFCGAALRPVVKEVLQKYGLQTEIPFPAAELVSWILHDKKKQADTITTVWSEAPGSFDFRKMKPEEITAELEASI